MNHGAGWVIYEESMGANERWLVSVLPPRRSERYVAEYLQQSYVDRFCTIGDRLYFKKHLRAPAYEILRGRHPNPMHIGHNPSLVAIRAFRIQLLGSSLCFHYKILASPSDEPMTARLEVRNQHIRVAGTPLLATTRAP